MKPTTEESLPQDAEVASKGIYRIAILPTDRSAYLERIRRLFARCLDKLVMYWNLSQLYKFTSNSKFTTSKVHRGNNQQLKGNTATHTPLSQPSWCCHRYIGWKISILQSIEYHLYRISDQEYRYIDTVSSISRGCMVATPSLVHVNGKPNICRLSRSVSVASFWSAAGKTAHIFPSISLVAQTHTTLVLSQPPHSSSLRYVKYISDKSVVVKRKKKQFVCQKAIYFKPRPFLVSSTSSHSSRFKKHFNPNQVF